MTILAYIIRIEHDAIRIPLCYLWFPIQVADLMTSMLLDGEGGRILTAKFWAFARDVFWIGHDGLFVKSGKP